MPDRAVGVTDTASGAGVVDYRIRERTASSVTAGEQYLIYEGERVPSFVGMAATFYMTASLAGYPLAYLFNQAGSGVLVAVRRVLLVMSNTSNTSAPRAVLATRITSEPTGGTAHTPVPFDTSGSHSASVVFKGAASADGTSSAITAPAGTRGWSQIVQKMATVTTTGGQVIPLDQSLLPSLVGDDPLVLAEGEGLLFNYSTADTSSSVAQNIVNCMWEEFLLP